MNYANICSIPKNFIAKIFFGYTLMSEFGIKAPFFIFNMWVHFYNCIKIPVRSPAVGKIMGGKYVHSKN